jgi:hypothetical protein
MKNDFRIQSKFEKGVAIPFQDNHSTSGICCQGICENKKISCDDGTAGKFKAISIGLSDFMKQKRKERILRRNRLGCTSKAARF